ncbi:hypothetical protein ACFW2V_13040 [Streptomyces sp. NPDC058947]|uniref:hypothetical protein n=1 Tax=Streptomyces sp. NPDC058947 TaxID=3346675 RepID=UPI0036983F62
MLTVAVFFTASAIALVSTPYWPGTLLACYLAIMAFWSSRTQSARGRRLAIEAEWWRRTKLGVQQPSLDPCCMRFDRTSVLHDEVRCTGWRIPELWVEWERVESEWKELVSDLEDLNQEEEA